jgi:hypothetical protein
MKLQNVLQAQCSCHHFPLQVLIKPALNLFDFTFYPLGLRGDFLAALFDEHAHEGNEGFDQAQIGSDPLPLPFLALQLLGLELPGGDEVRVFRGTTNIQQRGNQGKRGGEGGRCREGRD